MRKFLLLSLPYFILNLVFLLSSQTNQAQRMDGKMMMQQYLKQKPDNKLDGQTLESISVTRDYVDKSSGIRHIYATQKLNGLSIPEGAYSIHISDKNTVDASNILDFKSLQVKPVLVSVSAATAVQTLMADINYTDTRTVSVKQPGVGTDQYTILSRNASSIWDIPCRLVYFHNKKLNSLIPVWEVQMMDVYKKHFWQAYIDAGNGKLLQKRDLIIHCDFGSGAETDANLSGTSHEGHKHTMTVVNGTQHKNSSVPAASNLNNTKNYVAASPLVGAPNKYRVFDMPSENPYDAPDALVTNTGNVIASVDGWHRVANATAYQYTRGNNVWAFQDPSPGPLGGVPSADPTRTAYNNSGPAGTPSPTEPFNFDYPFDLSKDPTAYQNGAIVNLFYWNNLMHDVYYQFGFDEVGGNFEASHVFSTGTKGTPTDNSGDEVLAQAQDGGGTNNANFLTLQDGVNGQMQMYLWTGSTPDSIVQISHSTTGTPADSTRYFAIQGSFGQVPTNLFTNPVRNKQFVVVVKNALSTVGTDSEGCSTGQQSIALPPSNNVTDKIVLIDRGSCAFSEKVLGAQLGGAAGVIVINNVPGGGVIAMGATDPPQNAITIPAVMVTFETGVLLKAQAKAGTLTGSLKRQNPVAPRRDGDLDNGVIAHEYGHGISSRLTGGPDAGSLSGEEQGGEGWSDYIGLYMTLRTNDILPPSAAHPNGVLPSRSIGNYVTYQAVDGPGIRPAPYSIDFAVNRYTYKNIGDGDIAAPHGVGSIWGTMMYEMLQEFVDIYGFGDNAYEPANPTATKTVPVTAKGNNVAMRLIIDGIKIQPNNPTFVQERDAILKADTLLYGARHACIIWRAFAKRGLGASALAGSNGKGDESEAFDVPLTCDPNQRLLRISKTGPGLITNGTNATYTITITNKYPSVATGITLRDTLAAGMTYVSATPAPASISGANLEWQFDLAANETKTFTVTVFVSKPQASIKVFADDQENTGANWTTSATPPTNGPWTLTTNAANAYSGTKFWYSQDFDIGGQESILRKATAINNLPANANLVFVHKYATESAYDGGVVEISTDGGITWTYLPTNKFIRNGYTKIIPPTNTPQIGNPPTGLAAFTGTSPGYVVSIAKLDNYAGMNIIFRFRMVSDQGGGKIDGWYIDDVLVLSNLVEISNSATVRGQNGATIRATEGTNAFSASSAFVISSAALFAGPGNLKATVNNGKVDLKFDNSSNETASRYVIERKQSNEIDFKKIGEILATNQNGTQQYTHTDLNVAAGGQYFYRILVVNKNGQTSYTNIAFAQLNAGEFGVNVYPNPAKDLVNISIKNPSGEVVSYKIFDMMGKQLGTFNAGSGTSISVPMTVTSFSSGTYFIEVYSGANTASTKMVINR